MQSCLSNERWYFDKRKIKYKVSKWSNLGIILLITLLYKVVAQF